MPTYQFEALNGEGKAQKGTISASTNEEAIQRIKSQGLFPRSVREQTAKSKSARGGSSAPAGKGGAATSSKKGGKKGLGDIQINIGGISTKMLTTFTRQFSTLQDAGLPILRSLQILEQQQKPGLFKNILEEITEDVSSGATLSDAMTRHPKAFDKLYCKMINAGEVAGVLDMILQRLAEFMEKSEKLKRKIVGAMIYPAVVISVAVAIVSMIMIVIVPKFEKIFDDFDTSLPLPTVVLINTSNFLAKGTELIPVPGIVWMVGLPFAFYFGVKLIKKSEGGKYFIDSVTLRLPVVGQLSRKTTIARFTRTMGTLIRAGVPILDGINITRDTTGNAVYQRALNKVHDSVRQGESFAEPLRQAKVCDSIVVNMIDVGEETGDLDKMLLKVADNFDDEVDTAVASLVSLLEPLMVVVLGLMVGTIVISLFLPLVKLIQSVA